MSTREKNPHAVALGQLGGRAGRGKAKARPPDVARAAAMARWEGHVQRTDHDLPEVLAAADELRVRMKAELAKLRDQP